MTDVLRAKQIMQETKVSYDLTRRIIAGLMLINRYTTKEVICSAEHDIIYSVDFDSVVMLMSEEEVRYMALRGWFEEDGRWAHHV